MGQQNSNSNIVLYVVIGVLLFLLIAGGAGSIIYINNQKFEAKQEALEKENSDLKAELEDLEEKSDITTSKKRATESPNVQEASNVQGSPNVQKTKIKKHAKNADAHHAVSAGNKGYSGGGTKVVIDGTGVRFRISPSLYSGYLTWENGTTRSVSKGTRLTYLGETDDWYKVKYLGQVFYVSKEFSYLEY